MTPGQPPCTPPSAEFDECQGEDNESACWWSRNDHLKMKADGSMSLTSVDSLEGRWVLSAACIAKVRPVQMYAKSCDKTWSHGGFHLKCKSNEGRCDCLAFGSKRPRRADRGVWLAKEATLTLTGGAGHSQSGAFCSDGNTLVWDTAVGAPSWRRWVFVQKK